jgi:hypothetical protein
MQNIYLSNRGDTTPATVNPAIQFRPGTNVGVFHVCRCGYDESGDYVD